MEIAKFDLNINNIYIKKSKIKVLCNNCGIYTSKKCYKRHQRSRKCINSTKPKPTIDL